jgi:ribosomal protein S18 acetylase RimI-like enzyme
MESAIEALRMRGVQELSLTVTAANERAVRLYRNIGFTTIKTFSAGVWLPNGFR